MTRPLSARVPAAIFLIFLAAAPATAAQAPVLPEEFSAADQYVESVPTSSGPRSTREAKGKRAAKQGDFPPTPVAPAAGELEGKLKAVATSPALGAPERRLRNASADAPSVPAATVSAIDEGDGGRLFWLLLALVAVSGAIAGTASYRHRARRRATKT